MDYKLFLLGFPLFFLFACIPCEEDLYGEKLVFEIPILTTPESDSLNLGDALWINVLIDKDVKVFNSSKTIRLDSFNFFSSMFISEISGIEENYYSPVDTIVNIGKLDYLPLPTALAYPVLYEENADSYSFEVGIVPKERGLYWIGLSTHILVIEQYDHPALYVCDGNKRDDVRIHYINSSTNQNNFENVFKQTQVAYLHNMDYDDFSSVGSVALVVH